MVPGLILFTCNCQNFKFKFYKRIKPLLTQQLHVKNVKAMLRLVMLVFFTNNRFLRKRKDSSGNT